MAKDTVMLTGPTPYTKSMSKAPAATTTSAHIGRGGKGRFGGADANKGPRSDISHPQSHSDFEALGQGNDGE